MIYSELPHTSIIKSLYFFQTESHLFPSRLHGLRSGRMLREFRGHTSFVNSVVYNSDGSRLISASSDGSVKIWDSKTTNCLLTFSPQPPSHMNESLNTSVNSIILSPKVSRHNSFCKYLIVRFLADNMIWYTLYK